MTTVRKVLNLRTVEDVGSRFCAACDRVISIMPTSVKRTVAREKAIPISDNRVAERAAYLAAFSEANGKQPDFTLAWQSGWWCLQYGHERPMRFRSLELREMTRQLLAIAAEQHR